MRLKACFVSADLEVIAEQTLACRPLGSNSPLISRVEDAGSVTDVVKAGEIENKRSLFVRINPVRRSGWYFIISSQTRALTVFGKISEATESHLKTC